MRLACLGHGAARCLLLHLDGANILLDCGLDPLPVASRVLSAAVHGSVPAGTAMAQAPATASVSSSLLGVSYIYLAPFLQLLMVEDDVQAVLLSTPQSVLALPYLHDLRLWPLPGPVYCTQAAYDLAMLLYQEMRRVEDDAARLALGRCALHAADCGFPALPHQAALFQNACKALYSSAAAEQVFGSIQVVHFHSPQPINGNLLQATALPAGTGLGSAVWLISSKGRRVGYLPEVHHDAAHPSYCTPFDGTPLAGLDALIIAPGSVRPAAVPGHRPRTLITQAVLRALPLGGSVIIPVFPTGTAWQLIESLSSVLSDSGLPHVPLLYVSPTADSSLALAATSMEFLHPARHPLVYEGQYPFPFQQLIQAGRLKVIASPSDVKSILSQPAVVFVSCHCLLTGPGQHLLHTAARNPHSVLLLCEALGTHALHPHYFCPAPTLPADQHLHSTAPGNSLSNQQHSFGPASQPMDSNTHRTGAPSAVSTRQPMESAPTLPPGQPLHCSSDTTTPSVPACPTVVHAQLDHGTPANLLADLLNALQPRNLILHDLDYAKLTDLPSQSRGIFATEAVHQYRWLSSLHLSLPKSSVSLAASAQLLNKLHWHSLDEQTSVARVTCLMTHSASSWKLQPCPIPATGTADGIAGLIGTATACSTQPRVLCGTPKLECVLSALQARGVSHVSVSKALRACHESQGLAPASHVTPHNQSQQIFDHHLSDADVEVRQHNHTDNREVAFSDATGRIVQPTVTEHLPGTTAASAQAVAVGPPLALQPSTEIVGNPDVADSRVIAIARQQLDTHTALLAAETQGKLDSQTEAVTVVSVVGTEATITLGGNWVEVHADSGVLRAMLAECVTECCTAVL